MPTIVLDVAAGQMLDPAFAHATIAHHPAAKRLDRNEIGIAGAHAGAVHAELNKFLHGGPGVGACFAVTFSRQSVPLYERRDRVRFHADHFSDFAASVRRLVRIDRACLAGGDLREKLLDARSGNFADRAELALFKYPENVSRRLGNVVCACGARHGSAPILDVLKERSKAMGLERIVQIGFRAFGLADQFGKSLQARGRVCKKLHGFAVDAAVPRWRFNQNAGAVLRKRRRDGFAFMLEPGRRRTFHVDEDGAGRDRLGVALAEKARHGCTLNVNGFSGFYSQLGHPSAIHCNNALRLHRIMPSPPPTRTGAGTAL